MRANAKFKGLLGKEKVLLAEYKKTRNFRKAAEVFGISGETLRCFAHQQGWHVYTQSEVAGPTSKDKSSIVRLYETGLSCSKVAKETGWSTPIVERVVKEAGLTRQRKATREEIAEAVRLKKAGLAISEITERIGKTGLVKHLEKAGVHTTRTRFNYGNVDWQTVKRKYRSGTSMKTLSKELGAPTDVFARHMKTRFPDLVRGCAQQHRVRAEQKWKALAQKGVTKANRMRYEQEARHMSALLFKKWAHVIDPKGLKAKGYHVDHVLSVRDACLAFTRPLRLTIVCHPANMQMLTPAANRAKNGKSGVSLAELKRRIREFEAQHGKAI